MKKRFTEIDLSALLERQSRQIASLEDQLKDALRRIRDLEETAMTTTGLYLASTAKTPLNRLDAFDCC